MCFAYWFLLSTTTHLFNSSTPLLSKWNRKCWICVVNIWFYFIWWSNFLQEGDNRRVLKTKTRSQFRVPSVLCPRRHLAACWNIPTEKGPKIVHTERYKNKVEKYVPCLGERHSLRTTFSSQFSLRSVLEIKRYRIDSVDSLCVTHYRLLWFRYLSFSIVPFRCLSLFVFSSFVIPYFSIYLLFSSSVLFSFFPISSFFFLISFQSNDRRWRKKIKEI